MIFCMISNLSIWSSSSFFLLQISSRTSSSSGASRPSPSRVFLYDRTLFPSSESSLSALSAGSRARIPALDRPTRTLDSSATASTPRSLPPPAIVSKFESVDCKWANSELGKYEILNLQKQNQSLSWKIHQRLVLYEDLSTNYVNPSSRGYQSRKPRRSFGSALIFTKKNLTKIIVFKM